MKLFRTRTGRIVVTAAALLAAVLLLHIWIPDAGQRALVVAAVWLALETMMLREASWKQVDHALSSERNAASAYIFQKVELDSNGNMSALNVKNITQNIALNILAFRYDTKANKFSRSRMVQNYLTLDMSKDLKMDDERFDIGNFPAAISSMLSAVDTEELMTLISGAQQTARHADVIGVVYSDNLANYYVIMRAADMTVSPIVYRAVPWAGRRHPLQ